MRLIATRIARSIPGFSVIGAQPRSSSDLSGMVRLPSVIARRRIEPRLKLAPAAANQIGQFAGLHVQKRKQFGQREFIEIKKRERAALRLGCGGNPNGQLLRGERRDLRGRVRRRIDLFQHPRLGLNPLLRYRDATRARLAEKPESIGRWFVRIGPQGSIADCVLKRGLRFGGVSRHQETKAVKLWKNLCGDGHCSSFRSAKFTRGMAPGQATVAVALRATRDLWLRLRTAKRLQFGQPPPNFLGVFATVESGDAKESFAARAETAAGRDHDIQFV